MSRKRHYAAGDSYWKLRKLRLLIFTHYSTNRGIKQINFIGKLAEDDRVKFFFITEKQQKDILDLS